MKHVNIRVFGKVQGVLFRHSAKEKADMLKLSGFARNDPDGSVYIEAEGAGSALDEFVAWCRNGSQFASIDRVECTDGQCVDLKGFVVY